MEWRIRPHSRGGYAAERGCYHSGGVSVTSVGVTMPAFIVYESAHFDTERQAKRFIKSIEEKKR